MTEGRDICYEHDDRCELTEAEVNVYASCDSHEKKACIYDCFWMSSFVTESL